MYYDEHLHRWVIDYAEENSRPEREKSCDGCEARKQLGLDACCGCAG